MVAIKIVLLKESEPNLSDVPSTSKSPTKKFWSIIELVLHDLNFTFETLELSKLDFQEYETINKFLNADIVIMDVTNQDSRPIYMYHKGNRESMNCMEDIVLIQASDTEKNNLIQDLKTTCKIKQIIVYRYDEQKDAFFDISAGSSPFRNTLRSIIRQAANRIQQGRSDHYLGLLEKRSFNEDKEAQHKFLWDEICGEIFAKDYQKYVTPKLIIPLMYAFRDLQDYQSMIELNERCENSDIVSKNIKNNMMISYLTAFARSRRNQDQDRDKALQILQSICEQRRAESHLSNDVTCLIGRIYKDKFTESNCTDDQALEQAINWYRKGFAASPNIYAGVNLLSLLAITTNDLKTNYETYKIILQLNTLLGQRGPSLENITDYWDVATYFELHAVQYDWVKACQAALHMYLLNPPVWYLSSTINNINILHRARQMRNQKRSIEPKSSTNADEDVYSFWIDFFCDAISANSTSPEDRELPARVPILIYDNYEKTDGTKYETIYVEAHLQINFHTADENSKLVIEILQQKKWIGQRDLIKTIDMNSIRSMRDVKRDNRSIFFFASENSEAFSSVELQICFSSAERRTAFNEKMSKYRKTPPISEPTPSFNLEFTYNQHGDRTSLGQGTYGKVYLARDPITHRNYAVKEIPMRNLSYTEILENEIKILSTLHHKNIVQYYGTIIDSSKKPPIFQVIMEYVDGGSLAMLLARVGPFLEGSIQIYTRKILEGVQYLHENRILHRDIKSANILVNSQGEIKIADFGTSKRLAGLDRCKDATVGTLQYMSPDVVTVSPMGYGPEVDIWSVGCTMIEMATGKRPFHNFTNQYALMYKLANEKQAPDIPAHLSPLASDFLSKCFERTTKRPLAKDLLAHPFLEKRFDFNGTIKRNTSNDKIKEPPIIVCKTPIFSPSPSKFSPDMEPAPHLTTQISLDDQRRSELAVILRQKDLQDALISQWMELIEEKCKTELLKIEKLPILLNGICSFLERSEGHCLEKALSEIRDKSPMNSDSQFDLERSIYLFIKAANNVLSTQTHLAPHVLFALDNIIRRIAEQLVGLIRPDFRAASTTPATPNGDSQSDLSRPHFNYSTSHDSINNDEIQRLNQEYRTLVEQNRQALRQLIEIEKKIQSKLPQAIVSEQNLLNSLTSSMQSPITRSASMETASQSSASSSPQSVVSTTADNTNGINAASLICAPSRGLKRSRTLCELEEEQERLLRDLAINRSRTNELLSSPPFNEQ